MSGLTERTGLLPTSRNKASMENVARDKLTPNSTSSSTEDVCVDPRVMSIAAELAEAVHATSSNDKFEGTAAAIMAARIRGVLRVPDTYFLLLYLLVLPIFERPLWCFFDDHCGDDLLVPDSHIPRLPWYGSVVIDLTFLLFFASLVTLRVIVNGWAKALKNPWKVAEIVLVSIGLLDVILVFVVQHEGVLWLPYIRPLLFTVKNSSVQSVVNHLILSAGQVANIILLLGINIFLFGWLGVLLFWKTDCDPNKAGNQGCSDNPDFAHLGEAFQNWFISLAFANILDLITDAKTVKPIWVLYIFAFVVSSIYILQSLVLAVIYNVYRKTEDARKKEKDDNIKAEVKNAFKKLDISGQGWLPTETITQLFNAFNELRLTAHISKSQFELLFDLLDANNDDQVSEEEFMEIFDVLDMRFKKKKKSRKFFHDCLHMWYTAPWYRSFEMSIKSNVFEYIIDGFVATTAILMFIQTVFMLRNEGGTVFSDLDLVVSAVFAVQLALKLFAYGPHEFWEKMYFRFDLVVTTMIVVAEVVQHASPSVSGRTVVRWVMVIRVLGIVRLLSKFKPYKLLFRSLRKLQKQLPTIALLFAVVMSLFSVIGMQSFGGIVKCVPESHSNNTALLPAEINWDTPSPLPSCDDDSIHYLVQLNFNDIFNSLCLLFAIMTSGDWTNIVHPILNRSSQWAQIYFYLFYICCNLAVLNLFVGFVIDSFLDTFKEQEEAEEDMSKWKARLKTSNLSEDQEIERIN